MTQPDIVLCAPRRTAIGTFGGSLAQTPAADLGATAIRASLAAAGLPEARVEQVVMGQVLQAGAGMNPARQAGRAAGLPDSVPAQTVNRVCGSGAQAIVTAAQQVLLGEASLVVAGGQENMDQAPYLLPGGRWGYRMGDGQVLDSLLLDGLNDAFSGQHSGWLTEDLAAEHGFGRAAQDAFAARSQQRFAAAQAAGDFDAEIAPVTLKTKKGETVFDRDEHNRPDTSEESLARLRPAFRKDGTITAGNAPGLNSAGAALIVAERGAAEAAGLDPMARLAGHGLAALDPARFGYGPVPATEKALARTGWRSADLDAVEINEAFAAVPLAAMQGLGLAESVVNREGGAIAHGHPIGATGAVLTVRLLHALARRGERRGLVTMCIGGGQGIALLLERH